MTDGVVGRQVDLAAQVHRFAVVLAEEEPDRIEGVGVGLDPPVTADLRAQATAANASATLRSAEQQVDLLRPDLADERLYNRLTQRLLRSKVKQLDHMVLVLTDRGHDCTRAAQEAASQVVEEWDRRLPAGQAELLRDALAAAASPGPIRPAW